MKGDSIKNLLDQYAPANALDMHNALQEIIQQLVLGSLARHGLFTNAAFHGGTCLRLFFRSERFSEDLDFLLKQPDPSFHWDEYLSGVQADLQIDGVNTEVLDKSHLNSAVKKVFLKTDSLGALLQFEVSFPFYSNQKLRIKLEVDSNPPLGSGYETAFMTFPAPAAVTVQSLDSGLALKLHALLCRRYVKGRDWFDLLWYIQRRITPNFTLLTNALAQTGPWQNKNVQVDRAWLATAMEAKINLIDWATAREDVARFLPLSQQSGLTLWSKEFFLYQTKQLGVQA